MKKFNEFQKVNESRGVYNQLGDICKMANVLQMLIDENLLDYNCNILHDISEINKFLDKEFQPNLQFDSVDDFHFYIKDFVIQMNEATEILSISHKITSKTW